MVYRSKNVPPKSLVSNSHKKNECTVDDHGSDTSASDDGGKLLVNDPLQIGDLTEHVAWLSKLPISNGYITFKLDTGAEDSVLPTTGFNKPYVRPPPQPTNTSAN